MNRHANVIVPAFVLLTAVVYLLMAMTPPADPPGKVRLSELARIPVVEGGRVKPLDTVARNALLIVSKRSEFLDDKKQTQPAIKWLADTMTSGQIARALDEMAGGNGLRSESSKYKVFRVENDQLLNFLGLEQRPGSWRYSLEELIPSREQFEKLGEQSDKAHALPEKERDPYHQAVLELVGHLNVYGRFGELREPLLVPPTASNEEWATLAAGIQDAVARQDKDADAGVVTQILLAYAREQPEVFNREAAAYRERLAARMPAEVRKAEFEVFFNHFAPFYQCSTLYVVVFALAIVSWAIYPVPLLRAAFWLALLTFAVHSLALVGRMYLQGRPPVTNLYSSAVFISWGGVLLCLVLEGIFRNGLALVVGAIKGFGSMLIAHHLAETSGDTLQMMQAVLDTNFWLATHVTIITFGYVAMFVAGKLGMLYILRGVFTPTLSRELAKTLTSMIYAVVCFAVLLSFVGTVLGGLWADVSWGRFWGWDPKENGALLIVIWSALILHARWGGMIKQRGLAVLAVAGNMVTGWSWFGTNQLGVGLHAYGFNNTLASGLVMYWAFNLAVILIGLTPLAYWWSFRPTAQAATAPRRGKPTLSPAT
jgi:ABC-type transport system involved in cytochrome c biogenesis permease subunit